MPPAKLPALTALVASLLQDYVEAKETVIDESCTSVKDCARGYERLRNEIAAIHAQYEQLTGYALPLVELRYDAAMAERAG